MSKENNKSKKSGGSKKRKESKNGDHKIFQKLSFWYQDQSVHEDYDKCVKKIADFETVEDFWKIYTLLKNSDEVSSGNEFHVFLGGIKPLWEDIANKYGGKWTIRVKKEYGPPLWEKLLLCFIGGHFKVPSNEVTGVVFGIKKEFHSISVWNKKWDNHEEKDIIRDTLVEKLDLPEGTSMDYRAHNKHAVEHHLKKGGYGQDFYRRRGVKKGQGGQEFFVVRNRRNNQQDVEESSPKKQKENEWNKRSSENVWEKRKERRNERSSGSGGKE